jgi:hypothetical protein
MFPHERSLVKRLNNKPFALLGINTDQNLTKVKADNKSQAITWRSWYDGSTGGPICKQYKVRGFPTIYVLDEKGIIRAKNVRGEAMDKAIDQLLAKMEKGKGKGAVGAE